MLGDCLLILNACAATATDGWCPTPAPITGDGTARPACCCARRARTAPRRCCCSTGRRGAIRAAPGVCRAAPATATRPPEQAAVREAHEEAGLTAERLHGAGDRGHRRGLRASAVRTGPTPPSSPTRGELLHTVPEPGERRAALGRPRTRWPNCRCTPDSPPAGNGCAPPRRCAAGPRRRTPAAPAAHPGDRDRGLRLVHAGRRGPGAVAAESPDQFAAASADLSCGPRPAGPAAAVIARTTTMRRAPASSTSGRRCASMPPIANHGLSVPISAAARTSSSPGAARPGLVGVGQHGPTQK